MKIIINSVSQFRKIIFLLFLSTVACSQSNKKTNNDMKFTTKVTNLYVIIGFLNEYSNGYYLTNETVDMFYVNEEKQAKIFEKICIQYLIDNKQTNDVVLIKNKQNLYELKSVQIAQILKQYYTYKNEDNFDHYNLSKNNLLFQKEFENEKLSYLIGVFIRNKIKEEPMINFANSQHKVDLTLTILKELNLEKKVTYSDPDEIPNTTKIVLESHNMLWQNINEYLVYIKTRLPTVSFTEKIAKNIIAKDGNAYLNGYVVNFSNIDHHRFIDKKVQISGTVTIRQGVHNIDEKGKLINKFAIQGREGNYKYINSPEIYLIKN